MKEQNFERDLPEGYGQVYHINAKDKKIGIVLNLIALAILVAVMLIAAIPVMLTGGVDFSVRPIPLLVGYAVFFVSMILYIVLHEAVHGIAYKSLTGERLTFGLSWSCAFCGVPNIFTYRKTALIALAAPLVTFTVILLPVTVCLWFVHPLAYFASALIFGLHLGGCCGDMYMILLLCTKFKQKVLLMKDTGPEQFLYLPVDGKGTDGQ